MHAKQQHKIPRLHLQYFAGHDGKSDVWTYCKKSKKCWSASPQRTAKQGYFYSLKTDNGDWNHSLDEWLQTVETKAAPIYEAIIDGSIPSKGSQERYDFAVFLASMHTRTEAFFEMAAEYHSMQIFLKGNVIADNDDAFEKSIQEYENEIGKKLSENQKAKTRQALNDPSGYKLEVPRELMLPAMGVTDQIAPIIMKYELEANKS